MSIPILIYTCDDYAWTIPPFAYLLGLYWSQLQPVYVCGTEPFKLPENFIWLEVESRIAARWSDGLIEALQKIGDDHIVWMLEDYWLCRYVDNAAIASLAEYMRIVPDALKMDLTADRLCSGAAVDVDTWGHLDIIETNWDTAYQFSTQAAIWNRQHLLSSLRPEMSPWDFELQDAKSDLRVLGTRQWPVRYVNGVGMNLDKKYRYRTVHIREGLGGRTVDVLEPEHVDHMIELGLLPGEGYRGE